jgi:hypothetical protein
MNHVIRSAAIAVMHLRGIVGCGGGGCGTLFPDGGEPRPCATMVSPIIQ